MASAEAEFNVVQFEKKLAGLRDSQDSINSMSAWCLENRQHHKKIVAAWLNVLKRVKIDHRLTLFYLANDVIQYSKRKNYEFVESWSTSLQKATTLVREEKVKHRILRIFKIWEQRGIYGEEFLADLSGLISVAPPKKPNEQDPSEFQPSYLIAKILACSKLEEDTDLKLKKLKENELKLQDTELILISLKDRQHVEDVEKEVEDGVRYVEAVTTALNAEIKARKHLLSLLMQADAFYRTQKGEVKVVANAYRSFGGRVRNLKKRLDEMLQSWTSPVPSPDVNAPSPGPDSDIELPGQDDNIAAGASYSLDQSYSANFYNPVGQSQSFSNNGFSSFIGQNISFDISGNLFNDSNAGSQISDGGNSGTGSNLIEVVGNNNNNNQTPTDNYSLNNIIKSLLPSTDQCSQVDQNQHATYTTGVSAPTTPLTPLPPPPLPPEFTSPPSTYQTPNTVSYTDTSYASTTDSYANTSYHQPINTTPYSASQVPYQPSVDEYNPEEEPETWDNVENILSGWGGPETSGGPPNDIIETPESPPSYEKEAMAKPIEYNDVLATGPGLMHAREDVDHRVLLPPPHLPPVLADLKGPDTDHRLNRLGNKDFDHRNLIITGSDTDRRPNDIDHRNLISLTGSPRREDDKSHLTIPPPPVPPPMWGTQTDQDYRVPALPIQSKDQDYRALPPMKSNPPIMNLARLVVEPPPPPPPVPATPPVIKQIPQQHNSKRQLVTSTPRRSLTEIVNHDNNESVDMELSDDESLSHQNSMSFRQNSSEKCPFDNNLKNNSFNNKRPFQSNNHIFNDRDNMMRKKHAPESEVKNPFLTPNKNITKGSPPPSFNEKPEQSIEINAAKESQNVIGNKSEENNMEVEDINQKKPLLDDPPRPWPEHRPPTPVQDDVPWIQNDFFEDGSHRGTPFRKRGVFRGRRDSFPGRDDQFQNPRNEFIAMGGIDFSNNLDFRGGGRGGMRGGRGGPPRPPRGNGNMWNGRGGGMRGNFLPPLMRGRGGFRGQFRGGFREQW